jgi:hypothetical protein
MSTHAVAFPGVDFGFGVVDLLACVADLTFINNYADHFASHAALPQAAALPPYWPLRGFNEVIF